MSKRQYYIDNLRWLVILLLIPFHAAVAWNTWSEPNYMIFEGNRVLSSMVVFCSAFFMPLLFLFAGISTRFALAKRSYGQYLAERVKRLLIPLVFGTAVFMPLMTFIAAKHNLHYSGSIIDHYARFFTNTTDFTGADGCFSFGQFWFLLYLFIISLMSLGVFAAVRKLGFEKDVSVPLWLIVLLGIPLPLLGNLLSVGGKSFAEFTYLFILGYYVFANDKTIDKIRKYGLVFLAVGLIASALNVYLFVWSGMDYPVTNTIAHAVSKWFMILGLIGTGKAFFDYSDRIAKYLTQRSFAFYSLHYIFVILMQYIASRFAKDNMMFLFLLPVALSYILTLLSCEIFVRVPFLSFLIGVKCIRGEKQNGK